MPSLPGRTRRRAGLYRSPVADDERSGDELDPGWRPAVRGVFWVLIPGGISVLRRRAARSDVPPLTVLRRMFVGFSSMLVLVGGVVVILSVASTLTSRPHGGGLFAAVVVLSGILTTLGQRLTERPLDCSDDLRLARSYNTRFFLRVAFSETPALFGFAAFTITGHPWLYPLGAAFTAVGFSRLAPTARNLATDQSVLRDAGCRNSLVGALMTVPPISERSP